MMLDVSITSALRDAERGAYDRAISTLVSKHLLQQIASLALHQRWQEAIWHVLYIRARRQNHAAALSRLEKLCEGVGEWYASSCASTLSACDKLVEARAMIQARQPHQSLEVLMRAVAASEKQQLFPTRRMCLAVLADAMVLSLGMASEAYALLEEIMPQALADENGERRANVQMVLAKYYMSTRELQKARDLLREAAVGYEQTETWKELALCRSLEAHLSQMLKDDAAHAHAWAQYEQAHTNAELALVSPCPPSFETMALLVSRMGEKCRQSHGAPT